jgi:hypothetical protein
MKILPVLFVFILCACSPRIHTSIEVSNTSLKPLEANTDILVVDVYHSPPDSCKLLARIETGGNVFTTDCSYDSVIAYVKRKALKLGGNVINITELSEPGVRSACYKIKANILYCSNFTYARAKAYSLQDSAIFTDFSGSSNPGYAILFVYRDNNPDGYARDIKLRLNDSIICKLKNNSKCEIKLHKEGRTILWAQGETRDTVYIDVHFGHEYFLKCALKMGILFGRPDIELIPADQARYEYLQTGKL